MLCSGLGNHRLFEGLWEGADFWTQQVLDALARIPNEPHGAKLRWHVAALLKLSEEVAKRSDISRFVMGRGNPKGAIPMPPDERLTELSQRVSFDQEDLERLEIQRESLEPFLLPDGGSATRADEIGHSSLERRPLIAVGDRILLLLPAAVSLAVRRFVVDECHSLNLVEALSAGLQAQQKRLLFGEVLAKLKVGRLQRAKPADRSLFDEVLCAFDVGRYAHVVLLEEDLEKARGEGFATPRSLTAEQVGSFAEGLRQTAQRISELPDYQGGLTLVAVGGIGRGYALGLGEFPAGWHSTVFNLPDLDMLSHMSEISMLRLWKLKEQLKSLREFGVEVPRTNGDANVFAYWWDQGWTLVPDDAPFRRGRIMVSAATDFIAELHHELRTARDLHSVPTPSGRHVLVQRFHTDAWFPAIRRLPLFVSAGHLDGGELVAVVETSTRPWWIKTVDAPKLKDRDSAYRTWEATSDWMVRVAPALDRLLPGRDPFVVEIQMDRLDGVDHDLETFNAIVPEEPQAELLTGGRIRIQLPTGFLALLRDRTNKAEKALCRAITMGAARRSGVPWSRQFETALDGVFADEGARFIHLEVDQRFP